MPDAVRNRPTPQGRPARATPAFWQVPQPHQLPARRHGRCHPGLVRGGRRPVAGRDRRLHKVRRIRRDPRVTIAPCTATGRLRGTPMPAWAELLPDAELTRVDQLMARKYRVDLLFIKPIRSLQAALHVRRPRGTPVALEIVPS